MIRGYVLFVPFPDATEISARAQLAAHRRLLHSVGIQGHLVGVADDTDALTPLEGIKAAVARMLGRSRTTVTVVPDPKITIDRVGQLVTYAGQPLTLTRREWQLLEVLMDAHGNPVSAEALGARLWPNVNHPLTSARSYVYRLRDSLGGASHMVRTEREVGWYFVAPAGTVIVEKEKAA